VIVQAAAQLISQLTVQAAAQQVALLTQITQSAKKAVRGLQCRARLPLFKGSYADLAASAKNA